VRRPLRVEPGPAERLPPLEQGQRCRNRSLAERFGRIDVWVNNAAVSGYGELNTLPVEAIDRILDVDLRGQVYGVKAVLPILPILPILDTARSSASAPGWGCGPSR